jgi:CHAT domain-containing protein
MVWRQGMRLSWRMPLLLLGVAVGGLAPVVGLLGVAHVVAQTVDARKVEADRLFQQGIQQFQISQFEAALQSWKQALVIYRQIKDRWGEGSALGNLGVAYHFLGNYVKAIAYHEQRLAIAREIQDRQGEGNALGNLGNTYHSLGNYAKAIAYHEQILAIVREIKDRQGEGNALGNLGLAYHFLGNYAKAIAYYEQSLAIAREIKDRLGEGNALGNLGNAYYALGNYAKAIEYLEQTLAIAREIKDRLGEGQSLGNLGNAYQALGNYAKAIAYQEQRLAIAREIKDRLGEGQSLGNLGFAYYALGNYAKAIAYQEQHLAIAREIKDRDGERIAFNNIGNILKNQNQLDLAILFYKQSVNVSESLRQNIKKLSRETQEIYTSSVAETYRNLADLLLTQGRAKEAQAILELLKVQESTNYDRNTEKATSPIQFPLAALEAQALAAVETAIAQKQPLTLERLQNIGQPLSQNRDRLIQTMNQTAIAIGDPKSILQANPNALFIQNLVVADKLWVLWTNAEGTIKAIAVPNVKQQDLITLQQEFSAQLGAPYSNLSALQATSQKLYNLLIPAELQAELKQHPKQHLIFSLDHVTRYIPVAALYDGTQYLTQRYTLSNLSTTDTNMTDRFNRPDRPTNILALGTSQAYPPNFSGLLNVDAELHAIVREHRDQGFYPGKIYLNEAFTADRLTQNLESYRVLHIATHGVFNPKSITASFLLLGNGDRLPISDIAALNTLNNTHLVVLSACQTGLSGTGQDGTELSGISNYFLRRGAKSVLASLWNVNDASTALLMQQFYKNLATGKMTKAAALRQVQRDFIDGKLTVKDADALRSDILVQSTDSRRQSGPQNFAHPYYWAPFILIGNGL